MNGPLLGMLWCLGGQCLVLPSESALMAPEASPEIWTATPPKRGAMAFAALFAVESLARSLVATVVSVQAHDLPFALHPRSHQTYRSRAVRAAEALAFDLVLDRGSIYGSMALSEPRSLGAAGLEHRRFTHPDRTVLAFAGQRSSGHPGG